MKKLISIILCFSLVAMVNAGIVTKANTFSAGTIIDPSQVNTNFDDMYNEFNGSIENINVSGTAAIAASKLNLSSIGEDVTITTTDNIPLTLNNSSSSSPIFSALDNGTTLFTILDGGQIKVLFATFTVTQADAAGTPPYSFDGDTDTGMFSSDANKLNFTTGGSERMRIDSAGQISMGIAEADGMLHVHTGSAGSVTPDANADELILENNGNAGMTILSPTSNRALIIFGDPDNNQIGIIEYNHSDDDLEFTVNNQPALTIDSSREVGIGTNTPQGLLHLINSTPRIIIEDSDEATDEKIWDIFTSSQQLRIQRMTDAYVEQGASISIDTDTVHILQVGDGDVELEVSDGATTGGGTIHRAASATHSSEKIKSDMRKFNLVEKQKVIADFKVYEPEEFKYKVVIGTHPITGKPILIRDPNQKLRKGPIFERAPDFVKDMDTESVVLDDRVTQLEIVVKHLLDEIDRLEARIEILETP